MRYISSLILLCSTLFAATTQAGGPPLRIGVDATFPPFESTNPDGSLTGFEIDLGNAICAEIGRTCQWVPSNFDGLIVSLKSRKIDAVFSSLGVTEQRSRQVNFTNVVWSGYSSMLSRTEEGLAANPQSLQGKVVGVQMGSMQEEFVRQRFEQHGIQVKTYQDQDQVYADLLSGRIDASFQDMIQAQFNFIDRGNKASFTNLQIEDELLPADTAIAVRKNDSKLTQQLNEGLEKIHANGTYDRIQRQYFGDLQLYHR
ncbi:transporter substrate-binding domain-containing protein [Vibrio sp. CDRSL-10 TSBA]